MKNTRIVFYGTPDFAVATLQALIEDGKNVVGVVTAVDKPAGRGKQLKASAVKEFALAHNLPVLQPENLKSAIFQTQLQELNPELQIIVAFRMLPKTVWALPKLGTFNLHASLLPQYRGAAPINWAIINGETKTGVTTFFIDDKIDTGEILFQEEITIQDEDTAGTLHDKLMNIGSKLVLKTVNQIDEGTIKPQKQLHNTDLKTAYKLDHDNTKIDWNTPAKDICNKVRGLSPYPGAWAILKNSGDILKVKIAQVTHLPEKHQEDIGKITTDKTGLKVAVKDGYIVIAEIQLPGKKMMPSKALLNGYKIEATAKML